MPTVLAAQGMTYLAVDLLGFPIVAAVALAGFLELALVASALLARAAALAGRTAGADAVAVWVVSGTSGLLAGVHELMVTAPDGTATWSADPGSVLAAAVRVVAPLVAAWLWERVLQAARAEQAERTLAEIRRDRRLLEVARAALAVRRLSETGHVSDRRHRRAARRLDRAHVAALRTAPPAPTLDAVLHAVGQVDHLPAATAVPPMTTGLPEHVQAQATATLDDVASSETAGVRTPREIPDDAASLFSGGILVEEATSTVRTPEQPALPMVLAASDRQGSSVTVQVAEAPDTLALAVEALRADPSVSGAALARQLTHQGRPVSLRSGQRWKARAVETLTAGQM